ncbi:glycerate kinase [Brevibacillus panacihumi]|uniref:glycerate kinase n=1 Tax=Brevibacillus panacihumi TaxID=497735 RepID=UPI003CFD4FDB
MITYTRLASHLQGADLLFTREGRIDGQTASGKAPMGVAQEANKQQVPVFVLAGTVGDGLDFLYKCGVASIHSIANGPLSVADRWSAPRNCWSKRQNKSCVPIWPGEIECEMNSGSW